MSSRATALPIVLLTVLAMCSQPLAAQVPRIQLSARVGIGAPSDDYQSACGHSSMAYGLDVQGKGRWFPQLSLDRFSGSGGGDVLCIPAAASVGTVVGGLRLDGATRIGLGAGARVGPRLAHLEAAVLGGVVVGRPGYQERGADHPRRAMPHLGGQVSLVLLRYAVLSASVHWTRLSMEVTPAGGSQPASRSHAWSPMTTAQIGVRIPLGRP